MRMITIYDTSLRDGSQSEEVSFTVEDKIRIAYKLDELGIHYIEGGWPGSNPRDIEFFKKVQQLNLRRKAQEMEGHSHLKIFDIKDFFTNV